MVWRSYELRPAGAPPMPESYKARIMAARPQFEAMAKAQYGIEINSGKFGINSRPALVGAKYAEKHGKGDAYHAAMFRAYWQEAQDISDAAVMAQVAHSVGLDESAFLASLDDSALENEVNQDILQAQMFQISGVPALVFINKYLIPGAQPYDELVRVVDYIRQREIKS